MENSSIAIPPALKSNPDDNFKVQMADNFHTGKVLNKHINSSICMPEITSEVTKSTYYLSNPPHTTLPFNIPNKPHGLEIDVQKSPLRGAPLCLSHNTIVTNADYESISRASRVRISDKQESSLSENQKSISNQVQHVQHGQPSNGIKYEIPVIPAIGDSGCDHVLVRDEHSAVLRNHHPYTNFHVRTANGSIMSLTGRGTLRVPTSTGYVEFPSYTFPNSVLAKKINWFR